MHLIGPARIGKDAVVRYLTDGTCVVNLALAFNHGKKGEDGKRPSQWVDAAFFGERAQKLAPYLLKGTQIDVHLSDPHIESYTANDGTQGSKLVARVTHVEFVGNAPQQTGQQQQARPAPAAPRPPPAPQPQARPAPDFSDMDDPIPF